MKKKSLWLALGAFAMIATGCITDSSVNGIRNNVVGAPGDLVVSVKTPTTRATVTDFTDATVLAAYEANVGQFTAYVFDYGSGLLQASKTSEEGETSVTFTGLNSAGTKRVVVVANNDGIVSPPAPSELNDFSSFAELNAALLAFTDQTINLGATTATDGNFLMTGEVVNAGTGLPEPVTLSTTTANTVTVNIERVVAKVELGTISFSPNISLRDLAQFSLSDAGLQRVIDKSYINPGKISATAHSYTSSVWYSAWGTVLPGASTPIITTNTDATLLNEDAIDLSTMIEGIFTTLNLPSQIPDLETELGTGNPLDLDALSPEVLAAIEGSPSDYTGNPVMASAAQGLFWYPLPNDTTTPTLLTLKGQMGAQEYFYPVEINTNTATVTGDAELLGGGLQRNVKYTVNITFNHLTGTLNPDEPGKPTDLTVNIVVSPWENVTQNATW
ncbi:MAG: hypothetical protein LBU97_02280 [Alistipes sp.]|jgi:hypothetical protein|nr:hypothetical protein [Alistipes sp.]